MSWSLSSMDAFFDAFARFLFHACVTVRLHTRRGGARECDAQAD